MRRGFDNEKYLELQETRIKERIAQFGGKLYLEFGGKLFDDYHASRVLPGFEPDSKFRLLKNLREDVEIIIAINGHGLRWHVCNAIAKGIVAELSAKDGKYYSLEGARVMVEGVPTRRLFVLFAKFVLLRPIRRTP